jgi:hypothetical protein
MGDDQQALESGITVQACASPIHALSCASPPPPDSKAINDDSARVCRSVSAYCNKALDVSVQSQVRRHQDKARRRMTPWRMFSLCMSCTRCTHCPFSSCVQGGMDTAFEPPTTDHNCN